jgi:hypothetical protein
MLLGIALFVAVLVMLFAFGSADKRKKTNSFFNPILGVFAATASRLRLVMASAHIYTVNNAADVSLVGATAKTVIQLVTGATRKIWVKEVAIGFKSVTATDVPVLVQLVRQSTAGTMSAVTPNPDVEGHPAAISTAQENATAEPTSGAVVKEWLITPIGGQLVYQLPLGDEIEMAVSSKLGLLVTAPQAESCRAYIKFNE